MTYKRKYLKDADEVSNEEIESTYDSQDEDNEILKVCEFPTKRIKKDESSK